LGSTPDEGPGSGFATFSTEVAAVRGDFLASFAGEMPLVRDGSVVIT
jgi:hypothetical protein